MVGLEGSGQPLQLSLRQGGITGRPRVPPSISTIGNWRSPSGVVSQRVSGVVVRATERRETALFDVARSVTASGRGSRRRAYVRVEIPQATAFTVCASSGSRCEANATLGNSTSSSVSHGG